MTMTGPIGLDQAPTHNVDLIAWARAVAALTNPADVQWCDGSAAERDHLTRKLLEAGTFIPKPESRTYRCAVDTEDIAEAGRHTYVCTRQAAVDPAVNWMEPVDMKIILTEEYRSCMAGRTMYIVPFQARTPADRNPDFGVQITDSEYVVVAMQLISNGGALGGTTFPDGAEFMRCLHSVGAPRRPGLADVPWPCDHTKYFAHFPEARTIWSYGSGFADNALFERHLGLPLAPFSPSATPRTAAAEARRAEVTLIESWFAETPSGPPAMTSAGGSGH